LNDLQKRSNQLAITEVQQMKTLEFALLMVPLLWPAIAGARDCKARFAVAYLDGGTMQVGLTPDQAKFRQRNGTTRYAGMCLDEQKPGYLIMWVHGAPDERTAQMAVQSFQKARGMEVSSDGRLPAA
jgi:hypothetical protein